MRAGRPKLRPETEVLLMGRNRACLRSAFRTLVSLPQRPCWF